MTALKPKPANQYKMNNVQVYYGVLRILKQKFAFRDREKLAKELKDFAKKILESIDGK